MTAMSYWPAVTRPAAKCTDCCEEPQARDTETPGTDSGQPHGKGREPADDTGLLADLGDGAPDDIVDSAGIEAVALREGGQDMGGEIDGVDPGEGTAALADGGSYGIDDHCVTHGLLLVAGVRVTIKLFQANPYVHGSSSLDSMPMRV